MVEVEGRCNGTRGCLDVKKVMRRWACTRQVNLHLSGGKES